MTRKDYQLIAETLRHCYQNNISREQKILVQYQARLFAIRLAEQNIRFDQTKFLTACDCWE